MAAEKNSAKVSREISELDQKIAQAEKVREIIIDEKAPIRSIYKWQAPERIYEPKNREWYVGVAAIAMIVIVYAALTNNFGLIFAIIALMLFIYAVNTIPPKQVMHEITNKGIKTHGSLYTWKNIDVFWVSHRGNHVVINFEVRVSRNDLYTQRLIALKGSGNTKTIVQELVKHVDYLTSKEAPTNPVAKFMEGKYQPLITFIDDEVDPKQKKTKQPKKK